jgi:hypothetical protein
MNEHVTLELADYLAGRLDPERQEAMARHIQTCPECAAEVAFASRFVESAIEQGLAHLRADRVVRIADEPGSATAAERSHLEACAACRAEVEWAGKAPAGSAELPGSGTVAGAGKRRVFRLRPRIWIPAAAALAAVLAIVILRMDAPPLRDPAALAGLISAEPLPVRINRSIIPADSFEVARLRGLEAYAEGDHAAARDRFAEALTLRPGDPEVLLYAGSSALLEGDAAVAAPLLEAGLARAGTGAEAAPLREELAWQLADARLEMGDGATARSHLEELARQGGRHAEEARRIVARLPRPR